MSPKSVQTEDKYVLRLPFGMRDRIKVAATMNGRSMNAEIISTLHDAYPANETIEELTQRVKDVLEAYKHDFKFRDMMKLKDVLDEVVDTLEDLREGAAEYDPHTDPSNPYED